MKAFARRIGLLLARIALLAAAAALCAGLTSIYADSLHPPPQNRRFRFRDPRRRPRGPQASGVIQFAGEGVLVAMIAAGGRKILGLRL